MSRGFKKCAPFFTAALIGGGFLARKLGQEVSKMMEGMMGEGCGPIVLNMSRQAFIGDASPLP